MICSRETWRHGVSTLPVLRDILGHESLETTNQYVKVSGAQIAAAFAKVRNPDSLTPTKIVN